MITRTRVASDTVADTTYVVTLVGNTPVACTCPGYHYRSTLAETFSCKHMRQVSDTLALVMARVRKLLVDAL